MKDLGGRWEVNVKMHLKETVFEGVEWIHLAQHMKKWRAVVYTALNFGPYNVGIALTN